MIFRPLPWCCLLLAVVSAGCSTTMTGRRQLTLLSEEKMTEMGVATFASLKSKATLSQDLMVNQYVSCVTTAILEVVPEGHGPEGGRWEALVFEDPSPNAFALPGGKLGVNTGMLDVATTSGQLAAVVGHEVAHVLLNHGNERMSQEILTDRALKGAPLPGLGRQVADGLSLGVRYGFLLPFSRKHESEADEVGQLLMAQAGFYPAEAITLWQSMSNQDGETTKQWKSTHPSDETRIERLLGTLPRAMLEYERARTGGKDPMCVPPVVYE